MDVGQAFRDRLSAMDAPRVLELGTCRWGDEPSHNEDWCPEGASHVKVDARDGLDVDVICDAHRLSERFGAGLFDAAIAVAVWEHLARPWVAAAELARVLASGAPALIVSHQTFPLHGYPHDYFRFSVEAMGVLFGPPQWSSCEAIYQYPTKIVPDHRPKVWDDAARAYLNVAALAVRA